MNSKLTIDVLDDTGGQPPQRIVAQYNPAELSLEKTAVYAEHAIPGLDLPVTQFVRGAAQKLTVTLTLDQASDAPGHPAPGVQRRMDALFQLVRIQPKTHAPPKLLITWGPGFSFPAVTESVTRKTTLFDRYGRPLRAEVTVVFREYHTAAGQLLELNLQSADQTKVTVLRAGDRLDVIAAREYGTPEAWRALAASNGIEDPRDAVPGTVLRIPPADALALPRRP